MTITFSPRLKELILSELETSKHFVREKNELYILFDTIEVMANKVIFSHRLAEMLTMNAEGFDCSNTLTIAGIEGRMRVEIE